MRSNTSVLIVATTVLALAVAALLSAAGVRGADIADLPRAAPAEVGMSSERLNRVSALMQRYIGDDLVAGTVTLIARHGKVVHLKAQGWRDKAAGQRMPEDAIFRLMSMTKPIVSVALMMLYEEGHFLLDDPISKWLPAYADKDVLREGPVRTSPEAAAGPVTVRHVLTHTSGLQYATWPNWAGPGEETEDGVERPDTLADAIENSAEVPLAFHPGEEWQYGASTDYVAILVEKISGMSVRDFLRQRIFEPLGMDDTYYNVPRSKVDRVAAVYRPAGPDNRIELFMAPQYHEPRTYFGGVTGLHSTVADYFLFQQMMLNGGELNGVRILSPRTVNLMISNHVGDKNVYVRGPGYGFGLGYGILLDPAKANDHLSPGSFMWGGAWGTLSWVDPVEDMLAVFMMQISSYRHLNVRRDLATVASQAIVKSNRHQAPAVIGYRSRR